MKLQLLTLLLLLSSFSLSFGQSRDFQVLVGLNLTNCINCYNNQLNKIDQKSDSVDIILVLSEMFKADSAKVIHKYNLRGITRHIVWSDSLLNLLTQGGNSVIAFSSKYHNLIFRYDLKGLPDFLFDYLHRAGEPLDSLFQNYPKIALGCSLGGDMNGFYLNKHNVYFINSILDEVCGYDLLSGKRVFKFSIPDSIIKQTFAYSNIPADQYKQQHEALRQGHMVPFEINSLLFHQDTISVWFTNYYYTIGERGDSVLHRDNANIVEVVDGKVVNTLHVVNYFKVKGDTGNHYFASIPACYYNDYLYATIDGFGESQPYNYHVLGAFKPKDSGLLVFKKFHPKKNPKFYSYSQSCISPFFNQGYFAFPLIDTLYPISDKQSPIPLNIIPPEYQFKTPDERCDKGIYIDGFYITDDYVWVAYSNNTENYETVVRHNRHTGENETSKKAINFYPFISVHFDPVNPDYLLFTFPGKNSILYRAKMF